MSQRRTAAARHAASAPRRRFPVLLSVATVLGLWFGLAAPETSPVAPAAPPGQDQPHHGATATGVPPGEHVGADPPLQRR